MLNNLCVIICREFALSSTTDVFLTGIKGIISNTALIDDALNDAALGLDAELLSLCVAGVQTDSLDENLLLNGAVSTLTNLLPDHLRGWDGTADFIASLISQRASVTFAGGVALC